MSASARTTTDSKRKVATRMGLLSNAIRYNRDFLLSHIIATAKRPNAAIRSLLSSPPPDENVEAAVRVAVVLSMGDSHDRAVLRSILLTHGPKSNKLQQCTSEALRQVQHPVAAYLLLPLLHDKSPAIRNVTFSSLLLNFQIGTAESILAAINLDESLRHAFIKIIRKQTQYECNRIFDSLDTAAAFHEEFAVTVSRLHALARMNAERLTTEKFDGFSIAAHRLQQSWQRLEEEIEFRDVKETEFDAMDKNGRSPGLETSVPLKPWDENHVLAASRTVEQTAVFRSGCRSPNTVQKWSFPEARRLLLQRWNFRTVAVIGLKWTAAVSLATILVSMFHEPERPHVIPPVGDKHIHGIAVPDESPKIAKAETGESRSSATASLPAAAASSGMESPPTRSLRSAASSNITY